ncbi:beta-Ala-His dipeptidase isoform X1 [Camelus dromedarius]|uniref:Beta-Ala-His dipeptidase isoform X1 n=4 Tax=Camelus TaxID=9836 RepID=A0A8B8S7Z8_CAMFR|nr:beta-Ala-His dipeptidase isoform X2 [Camelus bactrianus]XP_010997155.2 beta-Ala-His dipeptidase isoform X1 [Camelus dromedarius]XP_032326346.1 beta-Ala-His dipeptidase isoform X1 [Camelus ferus]
MVRSTIGLIEHFSCIIKFIKADTGRATSVKQSHGALGDLASSLLAFLLLLDGGMFAPSSPPTGLLERVFRYIDLHQDEFVQTLKEWVAIESDSVQPVPHFRRELLRMVALAADQLWRLGASVDSVDTSSQQLPDGQTLPVPPIILAELGNDPKKPTVCFYGHLDVQPARREDGWLTDPYTLTEVDGKLYGRGTTDNKGPVLAWINAVSTFRALDEDLPVNIKFVIEGMEEAGSLALEELVQKEKAGFFSSVDYVVISDNLWLSRTKPALTYGTRGNSYFSVEVKCRDQDFHSGTFGGILNEPMADLVALLGSLVDSSGRILIPGIYDHVAPLTEEEKRTYEAIDLDLEEYQNSSRVKKFLFDTKEELLMHLWRYPSLSIHGVEGAFDKPGAKTVIPGRVIGKFSIRLVPHMNTSVVEKQVKQHLDHIFSKRNSSNQMTVSMTLGLQPWVADVGDKQYLAAKRAIKTVFGTEPDVIRDGSTIPIARTFQDTIQKSVLLLPLGAADDGEHAQNEKINRWNYIEGSKLFAAFFLEMAKLHSPWQEPSSLDLTY